MYWKMFPREGMKTGVQRQKITNGVKESWTNIGVSKQV